MDLADGAREPGAAKNAVVCRAIKRPRNLAKTLILSLSVVVALLSGVSPPVHADSPDGGGGQPGAWAVIIGIDHYANGENLQSARADASDMDQVLANDGIPASHRLVLSDSQATGAAIRNAATWLA